MDSGPNEGSEARFAAYVEALGAVLGHADRQEPMRDYCLGLLMPIERKSVEPMAAVTAPAQVAAKHQSLLHFVGNAPWSDTCQPTSGTGKGFGCRPGASDRPGIGAGVRKPPRDEPAGKAAKGLPSMGIWRGSGFGGECFSGDHRELKAADDCGLAAPAILDGLIEDWSVMACRRWQALG